MLFPIYVYIPWDGGPRDSLPLLGVFLPQDLVEGAHVGEEPLEGEPVEAEGRRFHGKGLLYSLMHLGHPGS